MKTNRIVSKIVSFFSRIFKKPTDNNEIFRIQWQDFNDGKWHTLYAGQSTQTSAKKKNKVRDSKS